MELNKSVGAKYMKLQEIRSTIRRKQIPNQIKAKVAPKYTIKSE